MKKVLIWIFAIIITIAAAFYQRITGPTYPVKKQITIDEQTYIIKLLRSLDHDNKASLKLPINDTTIKVMVLFHRYKINEPYDTIIFSDQPAREPRRGFMKLIFGKSEFENPYKMAVLPDQPPAGKLQYYLVFNDKNKISELCKEKPIVIRFKGKVPAWALIPHIITIFLAMLFANLSGLMAAFNVNNYRKNLNIALIMLIISGFIFGPIVQKFAFGAFWTGVPFGWDLTDNKVLFAFLFLLLAFFGNKKKERRWLIIIASISVLIIFSIPHSMFGSELNYSTGIISQG